ncbi:HEPN domain-containing protein [Erwinia aphidicola]|uniref:HEPN domain-containing protein n=1 Tax=Erwinia aphidicola TaxID=68334 RepID=UPI0020A0DD9E|nr:HEPN domain-containing protein [Erwinia aphidicola]MCP2231848.1 hypothetical protein [Erwinia aphidicola]
MYTTLEDFHGDIAKAKSLLQMTVLLKDFSGVSFVGESLSSELSHEKKTGNSDGDPVNNADAGLLNKIDSLYSCSRNNHSNLTILNGTLLLFISGRFESFVRETFEELCKNIVDMSERYCYLPKEMRVNLIKFTSEVISNPRKYGHADGGVKSFVRILSKNLIDDEDLAEVNHQCLSVTHENMRAEILSDLFKRVGVNDIWERVSQQSQMQVHFGTGEASAAKSKAEKLLNDIMTTRNHIAHPSRSVTWPDAEFINGALNFLETLSSVLIDSLNASEFEVRSKIESSRNRNGS